LHGQDIKCPSFDLDVAWLGLHLGMNLHDRAIHRSFSLELHEIVVRQEMRLIARILVDWRVPSIICLRDSLSDLYDRSANGGGVLRVVV
jgi:hypothetical protein